MRKLLIETGTPQRNQQFGHIGPLPNVRNAIEKLKKSIIHIDLDKHQHHITDDINDYLEQYDIVMINLRDEESHQTILIPKASQLNQGKRVYIHNHVSSPGQVSINLITTALENSASLSLISDGGRWLVREKIS